MLRSPQVSSQRTRVARGLSEEFHELLAFRSNAMLNADPPRHTRLRGPARGVGAADVRPA